MWETTITLFALVIVVWFWWRKRKLSLFKRMNIPGPTPEFFFGNISEISRKGQKRCFKEWIDKYGKVFGYYSGLRPILVVVDLDMINTIMVNKFQHYSSKPTLNEIGVISENFQKYSIISVNGKQWKRLRRIMTPVFSSLKIKMVIPIMQQAIKELVGAVERESLKQRSFNIHVLYQKLTMDIIARSSLGLHTKAQEDPDDPFFKRVLSTMVETHIYIKMLACCFPELWWALSIVWHIISWWRTTEKSRNQLEQLVLAAVRSRKEDPKNRRKDLLQLLIDGRNVDDLIDDKERDQNPSKDAEKLSEEEIVQNAMTVLFAGYETTSIALGCITHLLAHNQDIQDAVREEIQSLVSENEEISYEAIQNMHRLEQVITEGLRVFPPAPSSIIREGNANIEVNGKIIPKEAVIHIPVHNIHHDPELWEDPEKFNPNRWSLEENATYHPMIFQTFGTGFRNCPGKRFAYIEMKLALSKLLQKYKFIPTPDDKQGNLKFYKILGIIKPKNGVFVEAQKV